MSFKGVISAARPFARQLEGSAISRISCRTSSLSSNSSLRSFEKRENPYSQITSHCLGHPRSFTTSSTVQASSSRTVKDPDHPSGVYFHQLPDSNRYAITFLPQPPSSTSSPSIIAYVTPPESSKTPIYELIVQKPDLVEPNKEFLTMMHECLKDECVPQDGLLEYEALLRKDGWAHLNDQRLPLMPGRIATPENIIASVAFTEGTIKTESYEPNDVYRIVTSEEGFMDLRPTWLMFIKSKCEQVN